MKTIRICYWIIIAIAAAILSALLSKRIIPEWIGLCWTVWVLIFLNILTYQWSFKKEKISPILVVIVTTLSSIWVNNSVTPLVSPVISSVIIKSSNIFGNKGSFWLTQEAEYKIKFPLVPIVSFVTTPLKENVELFPVASNEEFNNYETNPFIRDVRVINKKMFIDIKRLSSLLIQETTIDVIYKRYFEKGLRLDISAHWYRTDKEEIILGLSCKNNYQFVISSLIYEEKGFVSKCAVLTSQFFLDTSKYRQTSFLRDKAAGHADIDREGNLRLVVLSPVNPSEEMNFYISFKKLE